MDDPESPTEPASPHARAGGPVDLDRASTVGMGLGIPEADPLARAVARSRAEAALFGKAAPVKVGRYTLIEQAGAGAMGVVWSAWDPELNRGVALKLAASGTAVVRARARDEGRALARLSHPNVVPIYDVFETGDGVFLVMELVTGKNLRALAKAGTPARELVRAYRQAGEGLAAAHRAGLIHRDFKPDNAIQGADGRVRVLDFGLAHAVVGDGASETADIAGTPRYMAPEQRAGLPLTSSVDQFALCVALREALDAAVPRWLQPILARGTAEQPAARFSTMDELTHALALDPRTRWRRRALVGGGVVAVAAVAAAFALGRTQKGEEPCAGGPAQVASSWSPARRAAVAAHLGALGTPYAGEAAEKLTGSLDAYAASWTRSYEGSCRAQQRGELSAQLHDRRVACLANRRAALGALGEVATTQTSEQLPALVVAAGNLPAVAACEDDELLVTDVAPLVPTAATEAAAISALVAGVDVKRDAAHFADARADVATALARAEKLAYAPLLARVHLARGRIDLEAGGDDLGAADFDAAMQGAFAVGDDPLAIESYARHAWAVSTTSAAAAATDGVALVDAIAKRSGERYRFPRALLELDLGGVAMAHGDRAIAREHFERARRETIGLAEGATELTSVDFNLLLVTDEPAERARIGSELVATQTRLLGASHPFVLKSRKLIANLEGDPHVASPTLASACHDLAHFHPGLATDIADCAYDLLWLAIGTSDVALGREACALVLGAASHADEVKPAAVARAYLQALDGDFAAATKTLASPALAADATAPWWEQLYATDALSIGLLVERDQPLADDARFADVARRYAGLGSSLPPSIRARRLAAAGALRGRQ